MKSKAAVRRIVEELKVLYPNARCSLEYKKDYELLFAVRLSAQCTDARVNQVVPALFAKYPSIEAFAEADVADVCRDERVVGEVDSAAHADHQALGGGRAGEDERSEEGEDQVFHKTLMFRTGSHQG